MTTELEFKRPIRVGMIGHVDSGKSTLVAVLTKMKEGEWDDGAGAARKLVMRFNHEFKSGMTSSIAMEQKCYNNRIIQFIDLAGHEGFLKTTLHGLCGYAIDYVILLVDANKDGNESGVTHMTREHFYIALGLRIPVAIVMTNMDRAKEKSIKRNLDDVKRLVKTTNRNFITQITDTDSLEKAISNFVLSDGKLSRCTPLFMVSNKTGENINYVKSFLGKLIPRYEYNAADGLNRFWIHHLYTKVKGAGLIVSGIVSSGLITKGDEILMGPFNGNFKKVFVRTLHDEDRNEVNQLNLGDSGCIAFRSLDKKDPVDPRSIRKGMVLINNPSKCLKFIGKITIYRNSATIKPNYQAVMQCKTVRQTVRVLRMIEMNTRGKDGILRTGDSGTLEFEFMMRPEYLEDGSRFVFRDGRVKGVGTITKILT